jgi:hypothetical protein
MGPRARPVPAFILQGPHSTRSATIRSIGRANILQWLGTDDYADDGSAQNWSVSRAAVQLRAEARCRPTLPLPLLIEHYTPRRAASVGQFLTSSLRAPHQRLRCSTRTAGWSCSA